MGEGPLFDGEDDRTFDAELADAILEGDDALLDLFADGLEDVHPRLAPVAEEHWDPHDAA